MMRGFSVRHTRMFVLYATAVHRKTNTDMEIAALILRCRHLLGPGLCLLLAISLSTNALAQESPAGRPLPPVPIRHSFKIQGSQTDVLPSGLGRFVKRIGIGINGDIANSVTEGLKTNATDGYRYMQHDENLSFQFGSLSFQGGYQYIGPYSTAPGYWGRVGSWTDPTNIQGPVYSARFAVTPKIALNADYEQYKAAYGNADSPLQDGDHLNRYQVGIGYGLSRTNSLDLGYEDLQYDLRSTHSGLFQPGTPHETYLTFGVGHTFNSRASLKLLYQIVRYDDKGTGFDPVNGDGGVAVGQFSIKF
jgi:hypothetical protein